MDNKKYMEYFRKRTLAGDYVILDNGIAEGLTYGSTRLFTLADKVGAQEIVIPDIMGNALGTIDEYKKFRPSLTKKYNYMAVLQGTTANEVRECLRAIDTFCPWVTAIGIPRILNKIHHNFRALFTEWLDKEGYGNIYEFHYLGASSKNDEVWDLGDLDFARGIDTSKPIYMGLLGLDIDKDEDPGRPDDYFRMTTHPDLVMQNALLYREWALKDVDHQ